MNKLIILIFLLIFSSLIVFAEEIGEVSIDFKMLGPNSKIVVEAFEDNELTGVACYVALHKKGGITGAVGLAENSDDVTISCVQTGQIYLTKEILSGESNGKEVFTKKSSLFFKKARIVRFYDRARKALVYMSYSKKIIEGTPKNNISVVPIRDWKE